METAQSFENFLLILSSILQLGLGLFVLFAAKRSKSSIGFFLLTTGLSLWVAANFFIDLLRDPNLSLFFVRLTALGICTFVVGLELFSSHFGRKDQKITLYSALVIGVSYTFGLLAILTPFVSVSVNVNRFPVTVEQNPVGYPLLVALMLSFIIIAILKLLIRITRTQGYERLQLITVTFGLSILTIVALITNILLPSLTDSAELVRIGPSSTIVFSLMIGYLLLRHGFFDIRLLLGRIIYFLLAGLIPYITFFSIASVFLFVYGEVFNIATFTLAIPIAIMFVIAFNAFNDYVKNQVTSRFINPGYNPSEVADKFNNDISFLIEINTIVDRLINVVTRTVRPQIIQVTIFPDTERQISQQSYSSIEGKNYPTEEVERVVLGLWKAIGRHPISVDEFETELEYRGRYSSVQSLAIDVKTVLEKRGIKLVLPIATKEDIKGLILFGRKEAEYPYTISDIDFLRSIASSASVALERSMLYAEVQEFANTLQKKVEVATADLKKANEDLQAALKQVQEARRRERDMMDVMGHELRTPISIVRNALAMLDRESKLVEATGGRDGRGISPVILKKYVDMGLESARREIRLIETLLSATKVDASRLQLYLTHVDFRDVINDGIEGQRFHIAKKPLDIIYETPHAEVGVYCDRTRVQEIMDNFLSNAVKYTMKGSITIRTWVDQDFGWISITDTGIGVTEEDLQRLGKKFFRARQYLSGEDDTKVVRPGGTGLGLYVTFELIRVMGGKLFINSKLHEGTTFTFSMPKYMGQPDKQFDQTFDEDSNKDRRHITINGNAPIPPA